jgi:hypothetical protein
VQPQARIRTTDPPSVDDLDGHEFGLELLELARNTARFGDGVTDFPGVKGNTAPIAFTHFCKRHREFDIHSCL